MEKLAVSARGGPALGWELEEKMRKQVPFWSIPILMLRLAAQSKQMRDKFLKLVDVLPALSNKEVNWLIKWLIVNKLAPHFIVKNLTDLEYINYSVSVDFLGESVVSEKEAQNFLWQYLRFIQNPGREKNIAVKFSSLYPFFGPENYEESKKQVKNRFSRILRAAKENNAFVTVDAEHYQFRNLIEDIFCETILEEEFRNYTNVGIALQAYLRDSFDSAGRLLEVAKKRRNPFAVRLVKGAYWDQEVALALQKNWPVPVFVNKQKTDINFDGILYFLMQNWKFICVLPATHNPENIAFALDLKAKLPSRCLEFQVLYGLGEPVRKVLCQEKIPVRVYTPVGDLVTGMSYFARRILENTANEGFLFKLVGGRKWQK